MLERSSRNKKLFYIVKKYYLALMLLVFAVCTLFLSGCSKRSSDEENKVFRQFTNELFCRQTAANTISLHYTLKNPNEFGIGQPAVTFGEFDTDGKEALAALENVKHMMRMFDYKKLSAQNRLTYDILEYYVGKAQEDAGYLLYNEPLGIVSGVQTQLPVLLSEYQFYSREDVDTYLQLLKTTPEYFNSLISFEKRKAQAGLFMSDSAAEQVISQCNAFVDMGESNYLISTFVDRIRQTGDLSEKEKSDYIQKNALMLDCYILPAYNKLISELQNLKGTGKNEKGLCYLPEGKEYYEHEVQASTGSDRTVAEMKELAENQIFEDLKAMESSLKRLAKEQGSETGNAEEQREKSKEQENETRQKNSGEKEDVARRAAVILENAYLAQEAASMETANPVTILNNLEEKISKAFPKPPETTVRVKYVPEAMEEHLSPAFYLIPAIDNYEENVIYVNQSHMGNMLSLFTTLAHEGYPGHLYQTIYYAATKPDPIRSAFSFGGYVEGWATYAEMCSYYLAPLLKEQATLLQKNTSILLGLYTLADIGIHYEGWSRMDTVSFFSGYGISDAETIERIYNLIIGSPGNYLKYYIGYLEFLELKKDWAREKGAAFSQKEFHRAVLAVGPAPFALVKKYMGELN